DHAARFGVRARARHAPADLAVDEHRGALARQLIAAEPDQLAIGAAGVHALERIAADERALVPDDHPIHPELEHRGLGIGVDADDDVALLEPNHLERLDAAR